MTIVFLQVTAQTTPTGTRYRGRCWEHQDLGALEWDDLRLGPQDAVSIPSPRPPHAPRHYTLDELVRMLIEFRDSDLASAFAERGQLNLGRHLYDQTLGRSDRYRTATDVDLRIISDDEHILRLPWPLLARQESFLVSAGWSISLVTRGNQFVDCELPPLPRMLVVAPEPRQLPGTGRDLHINQLQLLLRKCDPRAATPDRFRVVRTWDELTAALRDGAWDIVYYYGHGLGDVNRSRLVFEAPTGGELLEIPAGDFADAIRAAPRPPRIAYVNCCQGDAGGLLGVGRQLAGIVPCVVTNRTVALVSAAQAQAEAFWSDVLLRGIKPQRAVATGYAQLAGLGLSRAAPHWFTPVLYANYQDWSYRAPQPLDRTKYDPHWDLKVDREYQFGRLTGRLRSMLNERKPRALAFLWFGQPGQGMTHFQRRLEVELVHHVDNVSVVAYRPRWPGYYADEQTTRFSDRALADMLCEGFVTPRLEDIAASVRHAADGRTAIVVLNHPHVTSLKHMNPGLLVDYLQWWDQQVLELLQDPNQFFLLAFSFQADDVEAFKRKAEKTFQGKTYRHLAFTLLMPLECLARDDLLDFLQRHNVWIPEDCREQQLDGILARTSGRYEATLSELEKLLADGYTQFQQAAQAPAPAEDDWGMQGP